MKTFFPVIIIMITVNDIISHWSTNPCAQYFLVLCQVHTYHIVDIEEEFGGIISCKKCMHTDNVFYIIQVLCKINSILPS